MALAYKYYDDCRGIVAIGLFATAEPSDTPEMYAGVPRMIQIPLLEALRIGSLEVGDVVRVRGRGSLHMHSSFVLFIVGKGIEFLYRAPVLKRRTPAEMAKDFDQYRNDRGQVAEFIGIPCCEPGHLGGIK
jgi:hypothetical protein